MSEPGLSALSPFRAMAVCNGLAYEDVLWLVKSCNSPCERRSLRGVRDVTSERTSVWEASKGPVFNEI